MKSMKEMRDTASKAAETVTDASKKAAYAVIGAPSVAKKRLGSDKWRKGARKEWDAWVAEGERLTGQVRDAKVVEDLKDKVDFDQLQGRVEKLRDQLEDVLANWKATFKPEEKKAAKPAAKSPAKKPAAKKKASTKPAAKKSTPAKKTPTRSRSTAKSSS